MRVLISLLENELFEAFASSSEIVYIYVTDMSTGMTRWSHNALEYFGMDSEYMMNADKVWLARIHPEDREIYINDIGAVMTGESDRHSCQYRALNRYGDYAWLECRGKMINDKDGKPKVFAGLMTRLDTQNKYDSLTGLATIYDFYNFRFEGKTGSAVLIGIDEFRKVVSNYGYNIGDTVLVEFSKILSKFCTADMSLYRMSGDEFLIIAPEKTPDYINHLFDNIKELSSNIVLENGQKFNLSVSAGAVVYPQDGSSKEELLNNMEHSLEYRKNTRRGGIAFFSRKIAEKHIRIQDIKEDLKNSIDNNFKGFELFFQPIVDSKTTMISGCEALLRWKGDKIKNSYPGEFIDILEEDGSIIPVGKWVMEQALKQQSIWQKKYGDIIVSFNVSYQQFMETGFAETLFELADKYDVNPKNMIVELTESSRVTQSEELAIIFEYIKKMGFQVALDDFGTGYASLEMLKKLPASFIKIEHSFVRELAESGHEIDYIIIENILSLSRKINCKSIIEGVENEAVESIIKNMNSTYLQGYYYSVPVCESKFEEMLEAQRKKY